MTLRQLLLRVNAQIGDLHDFTQERRSLSVQYINEAYRDMMHVFRPRKCFEMEHIQGEFALLDVDDTCACIERILQEGKEKSYLIDGATVVVQDASPLPLTIEGKYLPSLLLEDDDVPDLPEGAQGALADYATWRFLLCGSKEWRARADAFHAAYLNMRAHLREQAGGRKLRHKFDR